MLLALEHSLPHLRTQNILDVKIQERTFFFVHILKENTSISTVCYEQYEISNYTNLYLDFSYDINSLGIISYFVLRIYYQCAQNKFQRHEGESKCVLLNY
jgi:hypothetical protein